ncbi:MAG: flagellar hook protein FlgE [Sulfuricella sp.]|nr:flagellar hook protein FlgE [Sulfuricella sp.]
MSFQQGLSGLNVSAKNLDVIGNNVANASTVGFKQSQAQFADVYAASLSGAGTNSIGIGSKLAAVAQQFTQGNISTTNNPLDVAINGPGLFRMSNNGAITYTRNGQFQLNKDGYIVGNTGLHLTGYQVKGGTLTGEVGDLKIDTADLNPAVSSNMAITANLDSRKTAPTAPFAMALTPVVPATTPPTYVPPDPTQYNDSTSITVYDTLGNNHVASLYFVKTATANTWDVRMVLDGGQFTGGAVMDMGQVSFDNTGKLSAVTLQDGTKGLGVTSPVPAGWTTGDWDLTQAISLDMGKLTQFGSNFGVTSLTQDGYAAGRLSGFAIDPEGMIQGRYTNGKTKVMGQMAVASFTNNQGLKPIGNNQWVESPESGQPIVGKPGSGNMGVLQSASVEDSNVDLTQELVGMITAQRVYQANAQTIKTQDQVLQTLVNLR